MSPSALFVTTVPITLEAFLAPFAEHFRANGWQVDAMANGASHDPRIADSFDSLFDISWSRNPFSPRNLVGTAARVRGVVEAGGYDIVHVHTPVAAFVTRYALRSVPRPQRPIVIYTAHGFHFFEGGPRTRTALFRRLEALAAPWTDFLVTINAEDYEAARTFKGLPLDRVRLIPGIGVDTERFGDEVVTRAQAAAVRDELDVPDSAFMIAMIAEFAPVKRHAHVLAALEQVTHPDVVLVLVGEGPLESQLREKVVARRLERRVRFAGYRRDVPDVLAASNAVLLASEREGLARSVMEGMAAGRPIIGTRTRGIDDAVGPEAGWIVPKDNATALAAAIDAAAADPAESARRGTIAQERARREFALPRIIGAYEELYREALALQ